MEREISFGKYHPPAHPCFFFVSCLYHLSCLFYHLFIYLFLYFAKKERKSKNSQVLSIDRIHRHCWKNWVLAFCIMSLPRTQLVIHKCRLQLVRFTFALEHLLISQSIPSGRVFVGSEGNTRMSHSIVLAVAILSLPLVVSYDLVSIHWPHHDSHHFRPPTWRKIKTIDVYFCCVWYTHFECWQN